MEMFVFRTPESNAARFTSPPGPLSVDGEGENGNGNGNGVLRTQNLAHPLLGSPPRQRGGARGGVNRAQSINDVAFNGG